MNESKKAVSQPLRFNGMETQSVPFLLEHRPDHLILSKKPPSVRLRLRKLTSQSDA
ncbi:MAG: hypothetical protein AAF649_12140 [Verrucomicrobiota bacterium]